MGVRVYELREGVFDSAAPWREGGESVLRMNTDLMFSSKSQAWMTPATVIDPLRKEFAFTLDVAAEAHNAQCRRFLGPGSPIAEDALAYRPEQEVCWLNPPYKQTREFLRWVDAHRGTNTFVCLVASRTDTRWWHDYVWDTERAKPKDGVEVRFIRGRLRFGAGRETAPFPSVILIFRRRL